MWLEQLSNNCQECSDNDLITPKQLTHTLQIKSLLSICKLRTDRNKQWPCNEWENTHNQQRHGKQKTSGRLGD
jgi:hypothetical protein